MGRVRIRPGEGNQGQTQSLERQAHGMGYDPGEAGQALEASWFLQGPDMWYSLLGSSRDRGKCVFAVCQCQVHVGITTDVMPSVWS